MLVKEDDATELQGGNKEMKNLIHCQVKPAAYSSVLTFTSPFGKTFCACASRFDSCIAKVIIRT